MNRYLMILTLVLSQIGCSQTEEIEPINGNESEQVINIDFGFIDVEEISFIDVDRAPIYPGCNGDNAELKACFSQKVSEYVYQNFNFDTTVNLTYLEGKHRVVALFIIDTDGEVFDVRVRAPHPGLERELKRVIKALPKMVPGEHDGKKVNVTYSLPIIFKME